MDSGAKFGQRKRTKDVIAWAKKKRKHIRRDELLAFLLDKPYQQQPAPILNPTTTNEAELSSLSHQKPLPPSQGFVQGPCIYGIGGKEGSGRKRTTSSTSGSTIFDFNMLGPDSKRMRL